MSAGTTLRTTAPDDVAEGELAPAVDDLDGRAVTTLRMLAVDMVESAQSGHPGMPLGCAPMAWVLWSRHLKHDPTRPDWPDRDRFVLSAGHGSALQYALLHLFGYDLPLEQLERFRQLGSATPGHPERGHTVGVETTTGPLGQGLATAVGMALAERMLQARFGEVVDHHTYVIAGDGCLMEGISHEAASLAGHLKLGRLVVLYDDNDITIDGPAGQSCSDDAVARFAAYGWHTLTVDDGNDLAAIDAALSAAKADERPSLVAVRTVIGYGVPGVEGTSAAHGSPLGAVGTDLTKSRYGWTGEPFTVPADVRARCAELASVGATAHAQWRARIDAWSAADPGVAAEFWRSVCGEPPAGIDAAFDSIVLGQRLATRQSSANVLAAISAAMPDLVGGSADLAGSTGTDRAAGDAVGPDDYSGRLVHFGIREHAMAATLNGIAAHGGLRAFGSTFLVFSDYLRPALRLSALMHLPVIYIFTHDSVAVGEDGPTHQPVEHVESLRLIPNLTVLRPADDTETVASWHLALSRTDGPTALILTRQALPHLDGRASIADIADRGARVVGSATDEPRVTILASGSEVALALQAARELESTGTPTRVVSVMCREQFADLAAGSRRELVGDPELIIAVEAGIPGGWATLTGSSERVVGVTSFGASGRGEDVYEHVGLTADRVTRLVADQLAAAAVSGTGRRTDHA